MKVQADSIYEYEKSPTLILAAFRLLCVNSKFLREYYPLLNPAWWGEMELKWITAQAIDHYEKYQTAPKIPSLRMRLEADKQADAEQKKLIVRVLDKLDDFELDDVTRKYVEDTFENFITYRATLHAVHEAQELIEDGDLDQAVQVVRDSQMIRRYSDDWLNLPDDADRFFEFFDPEALKQSTVPIGIAPLDRKIEGGARRKELNVIVAPLGYGKSQMLVHIGSEAIRRGFNVVHFSFENGKEETLARYMYNLLSINSEILKSYKVLTPAYRERLEEMKTFGGKLKIMRLVGSNTTAVDLSGYLSRLEDADWKPTVVIVDYGDLMAAARRSSHQSKKYEELQTVFEELRDLAETHNVVLWTAAQANREGLKGKRVLTHHIADALGKAFTADVIISMSKEQKEHEGHEIGNDEDGTEDETDNGIRILHLLKLRRGGSDNWWVKAKTRYAQAKLVCDDWEDDTTDIEVEASNHWKSRRKDDDAPEA